MKTKLTDIDQSGADDGDVPVWNESTSEWVPGPGGGGGGSAVNVEDEGTEIVEGATAINFVGDGVTVTESPSGTAVVTIPGGSGGGGVPDGGTTGQVLAKASDTDQDVEWVDPSGGGGGSGISIPNLIQSAYARGDSGDITATFTDPVTEGNLLVAIMTGGGAALTLSLQDWHYIYCAQPTSNQQCTIAFKFADGTEEDVSCGGTDKHNLAIYETDGDRINLFCTTRLQTYDSTWYTFMPEGPWGAALTIAALEHDGNGEFALTTTGLEESYVFTGGNHRGLNFVMRNDHGKVYGTIDGPDSAMCAVVHVGKTYVAPPAGHAVWRILCVSNNGGVLTGFAEVGLLDGSTDLNGLLPTPTSKSFFSSSTYGAPKGIDNDLATWSLSDFESTGWWFQWDFGSTLVNPTGMYMNRGTVDTAGYLLQAWKVQYLDDDGLSWIDVASISGQTAWGTNENREFTF